MARRWREHDVGVDELLAAVGLRRPRAGAALMPALPCRTRTPSRAKPAGDVERLRQRQRLDPRVAPRSTGRRHARRSPCTPTRSALRRATSSTSLVAMSVLRRHAVGEHAHAADAVAVDERDLGAELHGDERGFVAGRATADDRDACHAPIVPVARADSLPRMALYAAYGSNLRPGADARALPALPAAGTGWLEGWRLTFGGEDLGWEGALATLVEAPGEQVFVGLYDVTDQDEQRARRLGGRRHRALPQDPRAGARRSTATQLAWIYVLDGYEGGLPSARYLGVMADAAESGGRAGRLRRRAAHPALQVVRAPEPARRPARSAARTRRRPSSDDDGDGQPA